MASESDAQDDPAASAVVISDGEEEIVVPTSRLRPSLEQLAAELSQEEGMPRQETFVTVPIAELLKHQDDNAAQRDEPGAFADVVDTPDGWASGEFPQEAIDRFLCSPPSSEVKSSGPADSSAIGAAPTAEDQDIPGTLPPEDGPHGEVAEDLLHSDEPVEPPCESAAPRPDPLFASASGPGGTSGNSSAELSTDVAMPGSAATFQWDAPRDAPPASPAWPEPEEQPPRADVELRENSTAASGKQLLIARSPLSKDTTPRLTPVFCPPMAESLGVSRQFADMCQEILEQVGGNEPVSLAFLNTGSESGTGLVVSKFAMTIAEANLGPVLLVGGSRNAGSVAHFFELPDGPGWSDLLAERVDWPEAIHPTDVAGLHVISPGAGHERAAANGDPPASHLIREVKEAYPFMVIDAGTYRDPLGHGLALACDATYLVFEVGTTPTRLARIATTQLRDAGATLLGCVLTHTREDDEGVPAT